MTSPQPHRIGEQTEHGPTKIDDAQLIVICCDFREGILGGSPSRMMCAAVSWSLAGYLNFIGIKAETVETDLGEMNHVWIRLSDGRALDPTADQFNELFPQMNLPPVYLGPPLTIHGAATIPYRDGGEGEGR